MGVSPMSITGVLPVGNRPKSAPANWRLALTSEHPVVSASAFWYNHLEF
jgi:hypothetical protein